MAREESFKYMNSVLKGTAYVLAHVPSMILQNGSTQTTERIVNPESAYLKELPKHLRSYEDCVAYYPNQSYIGNFNPNQLNELDFPWYNQKMPEAQRFGPFGEIMPEEEFYLLMQMADEFELVHLDADFVAKALPKLEANPVITEEMLARVKTDEKLADFERYVNDEEAEPLYFGDKLVGCIRRAHNIDVNLSAHVMLENLAGKASSALALAHAVKNAGIDKDAIEYVIDCSEEACGDQNQRGGGNFAKATAEMVGLKNATGSDTRGFCAAPSHAILEAAALVESGVFKAVAVTAGGCTAKLGMNGKDHIKKGVPILEDCLAGFTVIVTENDGQSACIDLEHIGRHTVGTGSAPQAVIASLVTEPLERAGLTITDVDKYSAEMQNPDITKPAGAGDVPLSNLKMIGALGVKLGQLERTALNDFIKTHGVTGFAATQGHIPSGVPYLGYAMEDLKAGKAKRVMIIGKGSLFLGRLTNLFDGVSFMLVPNRAEKPQGSSQEDIRQLIASSLRDFAQSLMGEQSS